MKKNKKAIVNIIIYVLFAIVFTSAFVIINHYFSLLDQEIKEDFPIELIDYKYFKEYCQEKTGQNFSYYEFVEEKKSCTYVYNIPANKWEAMDTINESDFKTWFVIKNAEVIAKKSFDFYKIADLILFMVFLVLVSDNLFTTLKIENKSTIKMQIVTIFGFPLVILIAYTIKRIIDWILIDLMPQTFDFFINNFNTNFELTYLLYENMGIIFTIYGGIWVLAYLFNYQKINDRVAFFRGKDQE